MATQIIRQASFALALAASMPFIHAARATTTYDLVKEFSIKSNPNGPWAYLDSAVPLVYNHTKYEGVKGIDNWSNDLDYPDQVTIARNKTGQSVSLDNGAVTLPTNYILMDPEGYGAVIQFQAPIAGLYTVKGSFLGLANPEAGDNNLALIELNSLNGGGVLFSASIRSGKERRFNFTVTLAAGDILYFQKMRNKSKKLDDVGLTAKIISP